MYAHSCMNMYLCVCIYTYIDMLKYIHIYTYLYLFISVYVYVYICIYVYVYDLQDGGGGQRRGLWIGASEQLRLARARERGRESLPRHLCCSSQVGIPVTWFAYTCNEHFIIEMMHFMCVVWQWLLDEIWNLMCDVTHSRVWHDSLICDMTHSCITLILRHDSFTPR